MQSKETLHQIAEKMEKVKIEGIRRRNAQKQNELLQKEIDVEGQETDRLPSSAVDEPALREDPPQLVQSLKDEEGPTAASTTKQCQKQKRKGRKTMTDITAFFYSGPVIPETRSQSEGGTSKGISERAAASTRNDLNQRERTTNQWARPKGAGGSNTQDDQTPSTIGEGTVAAQGNRQ
ncbi:hypothetical protein NDU88_004786 [Pleurodeles waltl]|uniref:Uncharacterized protein n=1 Tax=Pleurodeles waltl TaxID=8319 RepID=A0AAV7TVC0_PLEWA|nr:hypothetical protein NDU88_004786 [Pleurodeles waltl]